MSLLGYLQLLLLVKDTKFESKSQQLADILKCLSQNKCNREWGVGFVGIDLEVGRLYLCLREVV